ncbi:hypothetical protein [Asticcacaulis excentricus]|uniref:hypothetical protein n=1 Tax=Asticcacaulis excentricus TaxID=78587 RepID=UPI000F82E48A|nr:hypothetical protein [Asticcacaulis excentricus]
MSITSTRPDTAPLSRFPVPHVICADKSNAFVGLSVAPSSDFLTGTAEFSSPIDSKALLVATPCEGDFGSNRLKCASVLRVMNQGAQLLTPNGHRITGKVTALRGAIRLVSDEQQYVVRNLLEITFDQDAKKPLSKLCESLLGGLVLTIDRNKPDSIFDVAGLILAISRNKAVAIPLADFTNAEGLSIICPPEWEAQLFPETAVSVAPTANSQSLRTMDFVLDVLRSNETIESESKDRIFKLTEVKFSDELEEV